MRWFTVNWMAYFPQGNCVFIRLTSTLFPMYLCITKVNNAIDFFNITIRLSDFI